MVYGASGEFDDSGKPAKNRAVSSAVAASKLLAGAAMSASMNAIMTAANILGMATVLFSDRWHRRDTSADMAVPRPTRSFLGPLVCFFPTVARSELLRLLHVPPRRGQAPLGYSHEIVSTDAVKSARSPPASRR